MIGLCPISKILKILHNFKSHYEIPMLASRIKGICVIVPCGSALYASHLAMRVCSAIGSKFSLIHEAL